MRSILVLAVFLLAVFLIAAIGGIATASGVRDWYPSLNKPAWTPPAWIFGPVWTVLYISIAAAVFFAWRAARRRGAKFVMVMFTLQLVLNAAWSWIFFGFRQPGWAFAEIVLLWLAIAVTTIAFFQVSRVAGISFLPYLLWVTFAAALNLAIWRLNVGQ